MAANATMMALLMFWVQCCIQFANGLIFDRAGDVQIPWSRSSKSDDDAFGKPDTFYEARVGSTGLLHAMSKGIQFEECTAEALQPPSVDRSSLGEKTNKSADGSSSRRVAIVFWKEPFRGPHGIETLTQLKADLRCTVQAEAIQRAVSASHVKYLIKALEKSGVTVDVILSGTECPNEKHNELKHVYNQGKIRVVKEQFWEPQESQHASTIKSFDAVLKHLAATGTQYGSLIFWRYDVVPMSPLGGDYYNTARNYFLQTSASDYAISVPGWMAPCLLKLFMDNCHGVTGKDPYYGWGTECVHPIPVGNQSFEWPPADIYRGPIGYFTNQESNHGPARICHRLRDNFGGPPCTGQYGAEIFCTFFKDQSCPHWSTCKAECGDTACLRYFYRMLDEDRNTADSGGDGKLIADEKLELGQTRDNCEEP